MSEGQTARDARALNNADLAQTVAAGYRRTEAGVIPEDWLIRSISAIASVKTGPFGSALHERDYVDHGTPIVTVEHLSEYGIRHEDLPRVSDTDRLRLKGYLLRARDIVFSRVGSVDRNSLVSENEDGWLFSGRLLRVRISSEHNTSARYLSYHLHSESFKKRVQSVAVGQTMASLNTQILRAVQVVLPPLPEQRAIAKVLSDVDELIGSLEALIAKKRAIKQAAMQELLTGKTRLPGFGGEWKMIELSGFIRIRNRKTPPDAVSGDTPCVELEHIGQGDGRLTGHGTAGGTSSIKYRFEPHDILFGRLRPYLRKWWYADRRGVCSTEIWPLVVDRCRAESGFVYALVQTDRFLDAAETSYGTHMPRADWNVVAGVEFPLPPVPEQQAIATVLSDMDAEIAALEHRLDKTRAIKQGVMQQLLTGSIRLPLPDEAEDDDAHAA